MSGDDGHKDEQEGSLARFGGGGKVKSREESWKVRCDHATALGCWQTGRSSKQT